MSDTIIEEKVRPVDTESGDHDTFAHYALKKDIERAIFDGVEIVALCGKKWLPTRDFTEYPICPTCKDIYESLEE